MVWNICTLYNFRKSKHIRNTHKVSRSHFYHHFLSFNSSNFFIYSLFHVGLYDIINIYWFRPTYGVSQQRCSTFDYILKSKDVMKRRHDEITRVLRFLINFRHQNLANPLNIHEAMNFWISTLCESWDQRHLNGICGKSRMGCTFFFSRLFESKPNRIWKEFRQPNFQKYECFGEFYRAKFEKDSVSRQLMFLDTWILKQSWNIIFKALFVLHWH